MVAQHEHRPPGEVDAPGPRVTVTEWPDPAFGAATHAYSHHAFERGYHVAVTELIGSLLPATESFLRDHSSGSPEVRETLYRFERFLAQRLDASTRPHHWVEHGGGI